jgi:hypothetical protein
MASTKRSDGVLPCRLARCKSISLSSLHASTSSPVAIRAMLAIDTLRSERSTPLRMVRPIPHSCASASWVSPPSRSSGHRRRLTDRVGPAGHRCRLSTGLVAGSNPAGGAKAKSITLESVILSGGYGRDTRVLAGGPPSPDRWSYSFTAANSLL